MDALWKLEDKSKISTQQSIILLVSISILVILVLGIAIVMILKNKLAQRSSNRIASFRYSTEDEEEEEVESLVNYEEKRSCCSMNTMMKKALRGTVCWSKAMKWDDEDNVSTSVVIRKSCSGNNWLARANYCGRVGGKKLPVWQRPILMGEKCELPRFSGLILYDERGRPLPHCSDQAHCQDHDYENSHSAASSYQVEVEVSQTSLLKDLLDFSFRLDVNSHNYTII